jgi:hypothetical protein
VFGVHSCKDRCEVCVRRKENEAARFAGKGAAPAILPTMDQTRRRRSASVLRFLGDDAGLKKVGKVGSVSRVGEIRTDVEDILPSAQIG